MPTDQSPKKSHLPRGLKQEKSKAIDRYDREIDFKNRIIKEKEKRVFNEKAVKKMNEKKISTMDLKSEKTIENLRQSSKLTLNSAIRNSMKDVHFVNSDVKEMANPEM
jgi:UDP-N-acetyl-D-mannosaminuronate dehydrogenase